MMQAFVRQLWQQHLAPHQDGVFAAVIVLTLLSSGIGVAYSVHKSRLYLHDLQKQQAERDRLETEWGQLLLEQHAGRPHGRIGRLATEQLQMRNPAPHEIIMVRQK